MAQLRDLWADAVVEIDWSEESGQERHERFDGHLIMQAPYNVFFSLEKAGETVVVVGSNKQLFWYFDMQAEPTRASICRIDNLGESCCERPPEFLLPHEMVLLSGLELIPQLDAPGGAVAKTTRDGIDLSWDVGGTRRVLSFPTGATLPNRLRLYSTGQTQPDVQSFLGYYRSLDDVAASQQGGPLAPGHIRVVSRSVDGEVVIKARELRTRPRNREHIGNSVFTFAYLRRAYRPQDIEVLDRDCESPALPVSSD